MPYLLLDPTTAAAAPVSTAGAPRTSIGETLASLQADLAQELGNRDDLQPVNTARWINKAYRYLCSILTTNALFADVQLSIVANQPFYMLPANVSWIKSVFVVDPGTSPSYRYWSDGGIKLDPINEDTYRKLPNDTVNYPAQYFRADRMLVIYPTPRESYVARVNFRVRPADLVLATDSPILDQSFHEALLLRAKHVAHRALKDYTAAGIARNDFVSDVRTLEDQEAREESEVASGIRPIRSQRDFNRIR